MRTNEATEPGSGTMAGERGHGVGRILLQLFAGLMFVVWIFPGHLHWIGLGALGDWLGRHRFAHLALFPVLGLANLIAHSVVIQDRRDRAARARHQQAVELGGHVVDGPRAPGPGMFDGPALQIDAGGRPMTVHTTREPGHDRRVQRTHATVEIAHAGAFAFQAVGSGHGAHVLGGLGRAAMAMALGDAARRARSDAERNAATAMAFLAGPPIAPLPADADGLLELRSNEPARARALLGAPGVIGALRAFDAHERAWEWTLQPTGRADHAELRMSWPGAADTAAIRAAQALMVAAVGAFERSRAA